jgi:nitrogen PTS system EIIA component
MEIMDLLNQDDVIPDLAAHSKRQILELLADKAASAIGASAKSLFQLLIDRERLGTTGIGRGIAIPHGRLASLTKPYALFARLRTPVAFDSVDDRPVDLVFLLLAPEAMGAEHLKALARVSRLLRDSSVCERLRAAPTQDALYAALVNTVPSRAA